jgi:hypothetical protein
MADHLWCQNELILLRDSVQRPHGHALAFGQQLAQAVEEGAEFGVAGSWKIFRIENYC